VLDAQNVAREAIVTALNKVDRLDADRRAERLAVAAEIAPSPVAISAREGTNLDRLVRQVGEGLPTERATIEMANGDDAMTVVSWLYDRADVADVNYGAGDRVTVTFAARPSIVERARAKAADVGAGP
jgi:GTP-binding protein HflX